VLPTKKIRVRIETQLIGQKKGLSDRKKVRGKKHKTKKEKGAKATTGVGGEQTPPRKNIHDV